MPKIPMITARQLIRVLTKLGFEQTRQKGSHRFFRHEDGRTTVVPDHPGEDLGRGITSKILNDTELTRDEFLKLL